MTAVRDLTPGDAPELTALYEEYEWWADREVDDVRAALAETEVAVGVEDGGDLVASARVLTDYTYYANVFDVLVATDRRGEGIGETLLGRSSTTPTSRPSTACRCSVARGSFRTTSPSASNCSTPRRRFRRAASRRWSG